MAGLIEWETVEGWLSDRIAEVNYTFDNAVKALTISPFDSSFSVSTFGIVSPFSHLLTACLVTKICSASSSCDRPALIRRSRIMPFVMLIIITSKPLYHITERGASNRLLLSTNNYVIFYYIFTIYSLIFTSPIGHYLTKFITTFFI